MSLVLAVGLYIDFSRQRATQDIIKVRVMLLDDGGAALYGRAELLLVMVP